MATTKTISKFRAGLHRLLKCRDDGAGIFIDGERLSSPRSVVGHTYLITRVDTWLSLNGEILHRIDMREEWVMIPSPEEQPSYRGDKC